MKMDRPNFQKLSKRLPVVLYGGRYDGLDGHITSHTYEYPGSISMNGELYVQQEKGPKWAYHWRPRNRA